tara:strand:+ start:161 stop:352 length:192 start_codon:yes stop_codon:yes gene_type:complete
MIETGLIIGAAVVVSFGISTACYEMRRSRCTHIECCGLKVDRTLMTAQSMEKDKKPELNIPTI